MLLVEKHQHHNVRPLCITSTGIFSPCFYSSPGKKCLNLLSPSEAHVQANY